MASTKFLVKTTLGTTILNLESKVDVHLNKDIYLEKEAFDLNVGDAVVYKKEYIETTLDEVEPLLESSPRYMHAKREIFERNLNNEYIPLLRTGLWRGILDKKGIYNDSIESIIKKEDGDFDCCDYNDAVESIKNLLGENGVEISGCSVKNWLRGDIYSPRDWKIFNALAKINPTFKEFDETDWDVDSKHYNYKFFVIARQTVMRTLARLKGVEFRNTHTEPHVDGENRWKIRLDKEIDIVVRSLMDDKGKDYALAKILSVEKLRSNHPKSREVRRHPGHRLSRGIETKDVDLDIRKKKVNEFIGDYFFVSSLFRDLLDKYIGSHYKKEFESFTVEDKLLSIVRGYAEGPKDMLLYKYNEPENKDSIASKRMHDYLDLGLEDMTYDYVNKITDLLLNDVFNGKMDWYFRIPQDSFKKLLEAKYKLTAARPKIFDEHDSLVDQEVIISKNIENMIKKGDSMDRLEFNKLIREGKEKYELVKRIRHKMEDRFSVKFIEHGGLVTVAYTGGGDGKSDDEKVIRDYDLEEFSDIINDS